MNALDVALLPTNPWWRRDSLLLAASGGLDSTVLLDLLHLHREAHGWPERLAAACFDHGWRGVEGARDAALAAELCARRGIPFFAYRAAMEQSDGRGRRLSPEAAARRARYAFLASVARREGFAAVATAHHAGDQTETLLLRLVRGGRAEGLAAIQPAVVISGVEVVRPLLEVTPRAIAEHAERRGLPFREDATNRDPRWPRNRLRLGAAANLAPEDVARLVRLHALRRRLLEAAGSRVEPRVASPDQGYARVDAQALRVLPRPLRRELLRRSFHRVAASDVPLSESALDILERVVDSPEGGRVDLPRAHAEVSCGTLLLSPAADASSSAQPSAVSTAAVALAVGRFDPEALEGELVVRNWRAGDRIDLERGRGRKRLKEVFREGRVPMWERPHWPVVADQAGVLWVPGLRRGGRARPIAGGRAVSVRVRPAAARHPDATGGVHAWELELTHG